MSTGGPGLEDNGEYGPCVYWVCCYMMAVGMAGIQLAYSAMMDA